MVSIANRISTLKGERETKLSEIETLKTELAQQQKEFPGAKLQNRKQIINTLSDEVSKLDRSIDVAENLQGEIIGESRAGGTVTEEEAQRVFEARERQTETAIQQRRGGVREIKAQPKTGDRVAQAISAEEQRLQMSLSPEARAQIAAEVRGAPFQDAGFGGGFGGGFQDITPTFTEQTLQQSLPADIRGSAPEEVIAQQSFMGGFTEATSTPFSTEEQGRLNLKGSFEKGDTPLEFGVPFILPSERDKVSPTSLVFELSSTTPTEAFGEGTRIAQLGGVQVAAQPFGIRPDFESTEFGFASIARTKAAERTLFDIQIGFEKEPESFIGKPGVETKDVEGGKEILLTPDFFEGSFGGLDKQAAITARQRTSDLPRGDSLKLKGRSAATGGFQFLATGAELIGSGFSGQIESQEDIGGLGFKRFKQRDVAALQGLPGRQRTTTFAEDPLKFAKETIGPRSGTQAAIIVGSVGTGLVFKSGEAAVGIDAARKVSRSERLVGSFSGLSPIRIKPGLYGVEAIGTPKVVSIKETGGGITSRTILGTDTSGMSRIASVQATRQTAKGVSVGPIRTVVEVPATIITKGGKVIPGTIVTGTEGTLVGGGVGRVFVGGKDIVTQLPSIAQGGVGESLLRTKFSVFAPDVGAGVIGDVGPSKIATLERSAGFSIAQPKLGEGISSFTFGGRTRVFTAKGEGGKTIFTPNRFRLKPEGFGVEFDINKILGTDIDSVKVLKGGGKKTPFSKTFQDQQVLSTQLGTIKPSIKELQKVKVTTKPDIVGGVGVGTTQQPRSAFFGTGQYERTEGGLLPGQQVGFVQQKQVSQFNFDTKVGQRVGLRTQQGVASILGVDSALKSQQVLSPRVRERTEIIQQSRIKQQFDLKTTQKTEFKPKIIQDPIERIKQPGFRGRGGRGFVFLIPKLPGLNLDDGVSGVKAQRGFKRTPSFLGAIGQDFGIKVPKVSRTKEQTGLFERADLGGNIKLPTTFLTEVKKTKRRKKKK